MRAARCRAGGGGRFEPASSRIVTIGIDGASCRAALAAAEDFPQVYAAIGRHPNSATGFDDADLAELAALAAHPKCVAIGETGLDFYREGAPRADQERAFRAQIGLARSLGKPLVIHTREASDETLAILSSEAAGLRVILHCFSMAERIDECLAHEDWWISFAGNVTYPKAEALRVGGAARPGERLLVETDAPFLSPQAVRGKMNQPANVVMTAQALAVERRVAYDELEAARRGVGGRGVRMVRLGQNFLVDRNILDVIERLAGVGAEDVVLEIGGGQGVLSERLAGAVAHLHVVEVDRRLEGALREVLSEFSNVTLHMADALDLDLGSLDPAPTAVVANLPYSIAATVILRTIEELPQRRELGGDGPARGGRAAGRVGRRSGLRRTVRAGPAGLRGAGAPAGVAHRIPPGTAGGFGAGRAAPA